MRFLIPMLVCILWINEATAQNTIYVDADAVGANNGTSWQNAFVSLQDALSSWQAGESIWVAEGRYTPDLGQGYTPGDRLASFELQSGQTLYGGFSGVETAMTQRNVKLNETVLSGDLFQNDPEDFIKDDPLREDNSDAILLIKDLAGNQAVEIDGFTVSGGHSTSRNRGGGMYVDSGGNVIVRNSLFQANYSRHCGGAIASWGSVRVFDSVFTRNQTRLTFGSCLGGTGAAIYQQWGDYELFPPDLPIPRVERTLFERNFTFGCGGALGIGPGGMEIIDSIFLHNQSDWGGATCVRATSRDFPVTISNSFFGGNTGNRFGGGSVVVDGGVVEIVNSVFSGNSVSESANPPSGAALYLEGAEAYVYNSTFSNNGATDGAVFFNEVSLLHVFNSIVWDDHGVGSNWVRSFDPPSFIVKNSIIPSSDSIPYLVQESAGSEDPLFVSPRGPDNIQGTLDDDLELIAESPAIGLGNPNFLPIDRLDLDGDLDVAEPLPVDHKGLRRIIGVGGLDLGAFEYGSVPLSNLSMEYIPPASVCDDMLLFPNPVTDMVFMSNQVEYSAAEFQFSGVFDLAGRRQLIPYVKASRSNREVLNFSSLKPGVYAIKIFSSQSQVSCVKIVVKL